MVNGRQRPGEVIRPVHPPEKQVTEGNRIIRRHVSCKAKARQTKDHDDDDDAASL
jgi:hypothetical protein